MKEPFIAKYYEDKLVRLYSLEDVDSFAVCDTKIQIIKNNGHTYTMEFDTYENAIIELELIKSKMEEKFEEEFEDICGYDGQVIPGTTECTLNYNLYYRSISELLCQYFGHGVAVKIKAKDGKIVIERIEE